MFEEVDSLGVSQGQGRGFAQVFDSTYNPVFKEEGNRLLAEQKAGKKEIDKQLESIDGSVWFRDEGLVKDELGKLYQYVQDNNRNILKGNTNEAIEYKKKINDIKSIITQSKLAEKETTKLLYELNKNENKYDRNKSKESLEAFLAAPGNFDISQLQLFANFDAMKHQKDLASLVGKITQDTQLLPGFKDLNDNTIYRKFENTIDSEIEKNARSLWLDLPESGREHYDNDLNKYIDIAKSYAKQSKSQIVKTPYVDPNQKAQEKLNLIVTDMVEDTVSIPIGGDDTTKKAFTQGKVPAIQQMPGNFTTNINFPPTEMKKLNAKPLSVFGVYQAKDGKVKSDSYDTDFWTKGVEDQGASEFEPKLVKSYAVFTPKLDSKGNPVDTKNFKKVNGELYLLADGKRWIAVDNILLDKENIKNNKFRGVSLGDENVSWVPHIVGTYGKKLSNDQTNFDVAIPYDEGYKNYVGANKGGQDIKNFEAVANEKDPTILQTKPYSRGASRSGGQQPTQTRTANDSTQKQTKKASDEVFSKTKEGDRFLKRDEYINKNYDKATLDVYDKYLKYSKGANTVAPLREMKNYSTEQIEEYQEFLDNPKRKGAPISIKQYFEGQ